MRTRMPSRGLRALALLAVAALAAGGPVSSTWAQTTAVAGTIRYFDGDAGVPAVVVTLSGATQANANTGGDGGYAFADPGTGDWQVAPAKLGGVNGAVTAVDARWALEASVGSRTLSAYQRLAGDVTGDGTVSALDAARILQLADGLRPRLPIAEACGSDWAFVPAPDAAPNQVVSAPQPGAGCASGAISFSPLVSPAAGQDFVAVAFGDTTGSWVAPGAPTRTATATPTATPSATRTSTRTATPTATPSPTVTPTFRDWRRWPFSRRSPWNYPIGSGARYAAVAGLPGLLMTINYDDRWTSGLHIAEATDPLATMLFTPNWGPYASSTFLSAGGLTCGNSSSNEATLLQHTAASLPPTEGNYYSTCSTTDDSLWTMPLLYHHASQDWRGTFHLPAGACPSPDRDAMMAVLQPDGWALDVYAAVATSSGDVVGTMASWIDLRGDGTGWWNGRHASMLPSFAGLIRTGEIASGLIPHALAAQAPPTLLTRVYLWPAYAIDRNSGYSGTLPMGALLAIPSSVDVERLGLSTRGKVLAHAAQDYGIYIVDRGGTGLNLLAELGNSDIRWDHVGNEPADWEDLAIIEGKLQWVRNNDPTTPGGGGTPRQPLAPPVSANDN